MHHICWYKLKGLFFWKYYTPHGATVKLDNFPDFDVFHDMNSKKKKACLEANKHATNARTQGTRTKQAQTRYGGEYDIDIYGFFMILAGMWAGYSFSYRYAAGRTMNRTIESECNWLFPSARSLFHYYM